MMKSVGLKFWAFAALAIVLRIASPGVAIETAGEVFVNVDAANYVAGSSTWTNSGSYDDFTAVGDPALLTIGSAPGIYFDGSGDAFLGANPAPAGLVGFGPTRTIEAWVFNPDILPEETVVSWGKRGGPDGSNMAFNYGNNGNFGAVGHWGGDTFDIGWVDNDFTPGAPEAFQWHHLAYTYDVSLTSVYADGVLANEEDTFSFGDADTHADTPIAIASQWEADGVTLNPGLQGSLAIGRLRIHDGVLTPQQIQANYNEEVGDFMNPDPPPPPTDPVPAPIPSGPIHRYSFNNDPTFDAEGGILIDSVSGADGVVMGAGSEFTGTELVLFGGTSDVAAYGDLPNGLISSLTDVSFEAWVTVDNPQGWSRIFDFGSTDVGDGVGGELDGPGGGGEGRDYLFLSAERGTDTNVQRVELRNEDPAGGGIATVDWDDPVDLPVSRHYVVSYDSEGLDNDGNPFTGGPSITVYRDGEQVGQGATSIPLSEINDVNNWLGRSNWTNDANFEGSFDEFRIYDYALNNDQALGNFEAGAETVNVGDTETCGDFDMDGDVDSADRTIQTTNWTGALPPGDPAADKTFAQGDCDGDGDVDTADQNGTITNWTGAMNPAGNMVDGDDANLIYDPASGNVKLDARDTSSGRFISFVLGTGENNMRPENLVESAPGNAGPFFDVGTNTDATTFQIGQTDPLNQGAGPMIDLGDIFPAGITSKEALAEYLTLAEYASELGAGGTFDLELVPEPSGLMLALIGLLGTARRRRRR